MLHQEKTMGFLRFFDTPTPSISLGFAMRVQADKEDNAKCDDTCGESGCPNCRSRFDHIIDDYGNEKDVPKHSHGMDDQGEKVP
jgi:hypothetical protein